jgi:Fe-S oxidoreductase
MLGIDHRRNIPLFATSTLSAQFQRHVPAKTVSKSPVVGSRKLLLFADVYTQFNNPKVGMATVRLYEKLGFTVELGKVMEDGRAALSQGLLLSAKKSAGQVARYLAPKVNAGYDVLFAEPSVLSMIRQEYRGLVADNRLEELIRIHSFDPLEYFGKMIADGTIDITHLKSKMSTGQTRVFYHGHCQMKSIGLGLAVPSLLQELGVNVQVSTVECCGMAGSFGYKTEYYPLSQNVGRDLLEQIERSVGGDVNEVIIASGTSCREQIASGRGGTILSPMEFLDSMLT